jgi:hypothetical protein
MGKYTSLARKEQEKEPQRRVTTPTDNILSVNIDNMHSNRDSVISKPTSDRPKDTHQVPPPVEMLQNVASGVNHDGEGRDKGATNLRTTNLTNLTAVACIHGMTEDRCAVCSGYVRWLVAHEGRLRAAQNNPEIVRREFWQSLKGVE